MIDFDFQIRKSPRRKTLSICIYPDNRIIVAAPERVSKKEILRFVEEKRGWIHKRIEINLEKARNSPKRRFATGEKLLLLGAEYTLKVEPASHRSGVFLEDANIVVRLPADGPAGLPAEQVRSFLIRWYTGQALTKIKERGRHYAGVMGVSPRSVTIKSLCSRWGSCSNLGRISLAWNIIMAPEPVLDYLLVHEFCHLVHQNHSSQYWKLVASFLPDYAERRKWLREHQNCLRFQ